MKVCRWQLLRYTLLVLLLAPVLSCSVNILQPFSDQSTNQALYDAAVIHLNKGKYSDALTDISMMTGSFATSAKVVTLKASAYGGQCGLNFLNLVQNLKDIGTTRLFPFLLAQFNGATTAKIDACVTAEGLLLSLGTPAQLTADQNLLLALVGLATIGNILNYYADPAQDGTAPATYDACLYTPRATRPTAPVLGDWYDADLRQLGAALVDAINALTALGSSISLGSGSLTSITSVCSKIDSVSPTYNFCNVTDPNAFTALQLKGIMSMIKESSAVGLGTNCTGDASACNCP